MDELLREELAEMAVRVEEGAATYRAYDEKRFDLYEECIDVFADAARDYRPATPSTEETR